MEGEELNKEVERVLKHPPLQQLQDLWRDVLEPHPKSTNTQVLAHVLKRLAVIVTARADDAAKAGRDHLEAVTSSALVQQSYSKNANEIASKSYDLQGKVKDLTDKIANLTSGLHDLAEEQKETNRNAQAKIDLLNRGMIALTILGSFIAFIGLLLTSQSLNVAREALALQKKQSQEAAQTDPRAASAKQTTTPSAGADSHGADAIPDPTPPSSTGSPPASQPPAPTPQPLDASNLDA